MGAKEWTVTALWGKVHAMEDEIADLRQQLADQQRDHIAKMLSVTKELAQMRSARDELFKTVTQRGDEILAYHLDLERGTRERDEALAIVTQQKLSLEHQYRLQYKLAAQRNDARRWAGACMSAVRFWRAEAHGYIPIESPLEARDYWQCVRGRGEYAPDEDEGYIYGGRQYD